MGSSCRMFREVPPDLLSKNCSLNRDVECPSVGMIFAHSFSAPAPEAGARELPHRYSDR